jgi:hypothetical protein
MRFNKSWIRARVAASGMRGGVVEAACAG